MLVVIRPRILAQSYLWKYREKSLESVPRRSNVNRVCVYDSKRFAIIPRHRVYVSQLESIILVEIIQLKGSKAKRTIAEMIVGEVPYMKGVKLQGVKRVDGFLAR